jgi:hypothetical protein
MSIPLQIKELRGICALAHNLVHKNCEEADWTGTALGHAQAAKIFIVKISAIKIKGLP